MGLQPDNHEGTAANLSPDGSSVHRFEWLGTGQNLLDAELKAIEGATQAVAMETFHIHNSEIARRFRAALTAAARRGVKVRVLLDAFGSFGLGRDFFDELTSAGGIVRWFNELRLSSFSFRDHRKLLVIDGQLAFVGGCNIASQYYGDGIHSGWRDAGVCVRGPVASTVALEFECQWERAVGQPTTILTADARDHDSAEPMGPVVPLLIKPGLGWNPLRRALRRDLETAQDVAITSAYFLPSHRLRHDLIKAAARGARVRLLLAGKSDVPLMQLASRSLYRRLADRGIGIWEYQPQVLHAKLIVLDDIVYVGSSNLDPRSLRINFEIMLRIQDAGLAASARQQFESDLAERSLRITLEELQNGRSWWQRVKQRFACWLFARLDPEVAALRIQNRRTRRARRVRHRHPAGSAGEG